MKILIVEDDPFIGEDIAKEIQAHFKSSLLKIIGPVDNYMDAIDLINETHPDIALLDIALDDDLDAGIRLAQYLNQVHPIPMIFFSGLPRNLGFDMAKWLMPFDFIPKPVDQNRLMEKIELASIFIFQRSKVESLHPQKNSIQNQSIFVTTSHNEATGIPLDNLILLEADDKLIRAYVTDAIAPIIFNSPGLKNFYMENLYLLRDFYQLNRKHVFNLKKVTQIKDNHVILPRVVRKDEDPHFRLPIPKTGDAKRLLFSRLGYKLHGLQNGNGKENEGEK